jgi:hypothetical protein
MTRGTSSSRFQLLHLRPVAAFPGESDIGVLTSLADQFAGW